MIVNDLLEGVNWESSAITSEDPAKLYTIFQFLRQLIMDSHLYVTKIIGFSVTNRTMRSHTGTYIARNVQLGESYAELSVKLADKLIIGTDVDELSFDVKKGLIKVPALEMPASSRIMYTNDEVCRVIAGTCVLHFKIQTDCGYRDMQQNSAELPNSYFPMNTYFNISEYVRVLPMMRGDKRINLRFLNGMDVNTLKFLLLRYKSLIESQFISKEELAWVQSFAV